MLTVSNFHDYQKYAIITGIQKRHCCIFLGTGLGKTVIALTIADQLLKRKLIRGCLCVCTKKAMYNTWKQEAKLWKHLQYLKINIIHGDVFNGSSEYVKRVQLFSPCHIHLINYEGLPWLSDKINSNYHNRPMPWDMVIYDESTKIKHSTTQRFRTFKKHMGRFIYRYPMTGTPAPNGIKDLFGQIYVMDLGVSLGRSLTSFRNRFFIRIPMGNYSEYRPMKGSREAIAKLFNPVHR